VFNGGAPTCSGDIWSIGAVLAELALGCPIFGQSTDADTFQKIKLTLRPNILENRIARALRGREPPDAIAAFTTLLRQMFAQNPQERLTAEDITRHPFMICSSCGL
jgi:serine/threonine protein kinase